MSFHSSRSDFEHYEILPANSVTPIDAQSRKAAQRADRAIDAALRSVPLPAGLMTRLGKLVYTMPDETAEHVDWLGC
jgi:hypothetical protein